MEEEGRELWYVPRKWRKSALGRAVLLSAALKNVQSNGIRK